MTTSCASCAAWTTSTCRSWRRRARCWTALRKGHRHWPTYEREFLALMEQRRVEETVAPETLADAVLLCSEDAPERCHRRLVAEYLQRRWGDVEVVHLR